MHGAAQQQVDLLYEGFQYVTKKDLIDPEGEKFFVYRAGELKLFSNYDSGARVEDYNNYSEQDSLALCVEFCRRWALDGSDGPRSEIELMVRVGGLSEAKFLGSKLGIDLKEASFDGTAWLEDRKLGVSVYYQ